MHKVSIKTIENTVLKLDKALPYMVAKWRKFTFLASYFVIWHGRKIVNPRLAKRSEPPNLSMFVLSKHLVIKKLINAYEGKLHLFCFQKSFDIC